MRVVDSTASSTNKPRTYLANGHRITWQLSAWPGWRVAVDAELADQQVPEHIRSRSQLDPDATDREILVAWTQSEVLAKLTDEPILLRLRRCGLRIDDLPQRAPIGLVTVQHEGNVTTVGAAACAVHDIEEPEAGGQRG